jgi:hydrogenase 3 maturation protease
MSNRSWTALLKQAIRPKNRPSFRIAVVGIGHELRGDDAAGVMVARRLQAASSATRLVLDAGPAPENFSGQLRAFAPDLLLLVDAVQMDEPPGTIRLLKLDAAQPSSLTTHTLSPHLLANYLRAALGCDIRLLGIQPAQDSFGAGLSSAVEHSVEQIVRAFQDG